MVKEKRIREEVKVKVKREVKNKEEVKNIKYLYINYNIKITFFHIKCLVVTYLLFMI